MLQNIWNLRSPLSVEVSMNTTPQSTVLPAIRGASRLAGDTPEKLKADSDHEHMNELAAMRHDQRWQNDCTKMLAFL